MQIQELMNRIKIPEAVQIFCNKIEIRDDEYQTEKEIFHKDLKILIEKWRNRSVKYVWGLKF